MDTTTLLAGPINEARLYFLAERSRHGCRVLIVWVVNEIEIVMNQAWSCEEYRVNEQLSSFPPSPFLSFPSSFFFFFTAPLVQLLWRPLITTASLEFFEINFTRKKKKKEEMSVHFGKEGIFLILFKRVNNCV